MRGERRVEGPGAWLSSIRLPSSPSLSSRLHPGPALSLQHHCVDFSWVNLGTRSEQSLWMENKSDCTACFHFDIDCQESVFSIRPAFGTLVGKARMTLCCVFQPTQPIIYWRRVACLIHHQVSCWGGARPGSPRRWRGQSEAQS